MDPEDHGLYWFMGIYVPLVIIICFLGCILRYKLPQDSKTELFIVTTLVFFELVSLGITLVVLCRDSVYLNPLTKIIAVFYLMSRTVEETIRFLR